MIPTIEEIRKLCTESSFERGIEYFRGGSVRGLEQFGNRITSIVEGTSDYEVTIRMDKGDIEASCTCPYDWGGYCKHIVATLLALSENYKKVKKDKDEKERRIKTILNNLSPDELKGFLTAELEKNFSLRDHFTIYFSGKGSKIRSLHDYKKEISLLYRETTGRHGFIEYGIEVDFSYICDLADRYIKAGNLLEAATIYQALSEVIADNMEGVDDSDGYYGGEFGQAMEDFVNCINRAKLSYKEKKDYIGYIFNKYIENDPDYFQEYYDYALREICQSKDGLEYWKRLLSPHLPEYLPDHSQWHEHYQAKQLLGMQLHILDLLDDEKGFSELIQRCYGKHHEFCLLYARHLEKYGKSKEAIKIAEEGLTLFPEHLTKEIRRFLNRFYEKDSPERYKQNLVTLFIEDRNWDDYETLKELCSEEEWKKIFSVIINGFSKDRFGSKDTIISMYLRERMFEEALRHVLARRSLFTLSIYHKDLSERFPERYFDAYKELLIPFADSKMGRAHYREIVRYLEQMKKIKGFGEQLRQLVKLLKTKYANRPAFLDEIEGI